MLLLKGKNWLFIIIIIIPYCKQRRGYLKVKRVKWARFKSWLWFEWARSGCVGLGKSLNLSDPPHLKARKVFYLKLSIAWWLQESTDVKLTWLWGNWGPKGSNGFCSVLMTECGIQLSRPSQFASHGTTWMEKLPVMFELCWNLRPQCSHVGGRSDAYCWGRSRELSPH
jgi:hypothetical protein